MQPASAAVSNFSFKPPTSALNSHIPGFRPSLSLPLLSGEQGEGKGVADRDLSLLSAGPRQLEPLSSLVLRLLDLLQLDLLPLPVLCPLSLSLFLGLCPFPCELGGLDSLANEQLDSTRSFLVLLLLGLESSEPSVRLMELDSTRASPDLPSQQSLTWPRESIPRR
jgi:hypothetical protein